MVSILKPIRIVILLVFIFLLAVSYQLGDIVNNTTTSPSPIHVEKKPIIVKTLKTEGKVKYIAHRGYTRHAPENTLPAYKSAGENGFWGGECDIFNTSDGKFVLMHDNTVDRTTNGKGNVIALTFKQIKRLMVNNNKNLDVFSTVKVPSLGEYLVQCNKYNIVPVIEIKEFTKDEYFDKFVQILKDYKVTNRAFVISFNKDVLRKVRRASRDIKLGILSDYDILLAKELGNSFFDLRYDLINAKIVKEAKENGFEFMAWTVNDPSIANSLEQMGVDYITTDLNLPSDNLLLTAGYRNPK